MGTTETEQGQLTIYKLDGPGYGSATITLEEWREADIIINDRGMVIKDTRTDYPRAMIPMGIKKEKASEEMLQSARLIKHAFDDDLNGPPPLPIEDMTDED